LSVSPYPPSTRLQCHLNSVSPESRESLPLARRLVLDQLLCLLQKTRRLGVLRPARQLDDLSQPAKQCPGFALVAELMLCHGQKGQVVGMRTFLGGIELLGPRQRRQGIGMAARGVRGSASRVEAEAVLRARVVRASRVGR